MKRGFKYLIFISFAVVFSCDKLQQNVNCNECTSSSPMEVSLRITLDDYSEISNSKVVQIYEGLLEDNILYGTYSVSGADLSVKVYINKKYTLTAKYSYRDGSNYVTVDSATPRVKYIPDQCQDPCYITYDKDVDLRLKYRK
jgi:hypothetical protein